MMVSTIETTLIASTIQQSCVVVLSLPPAQGEQEGYPSRDLQCQGELSPPQPSIKPIKAARQTRHLNYRDTDRTLLRRGPSARARMVWVGLLLWLAAVAPSDSQIVAVHATAIYDTQCSSTAMQMQRNHSTDGGVFGSAFGLKSGMSRPRGGLLCTARCHMPVTHCTPTAPPAASVSLAGDGAAGSRCIPLPLCA